MKWLDLRDARAAYYLPSHYWATFPHRDAIRARSSDGIGRTSSGGSSHGDHRSSPRAAGESIRHERFGIKHSAVHDGLYEGRVVGSDKYAPDACLHLEAPLIAPGDMWLPTNHVAAVERTIGRDDRGKGQGGGVHAWPSCNRPLSRFLRGTFPRRCLLPLRRRRSPPRFAQQDPRRRVVARFG
jgi:hypothetical protein